MIDLDGADNRSRTYDLRITNYKNYLLSQQHTTSYLRSHVPSSKDMQSLANRCKALCVSVLSHITWLSLNSQERASLMM